MCGNFFPHTCFISDIMEKYQLVNKQQETDHVLKTKIEEMVKLYKTQLETVKDELHRIKQKSSTDYLTEVVEATPKHKEVQLELNEKNEELKQIEALEKQNRSLQKKGQELKEELDKINEKVNQIKKQNQTLQDKNFKINEELVWCKEVRIPELIE